ncbi:hypothetical protein EV130_10831 [Rhizobium azibense]|nr:MULTISPECIES: hypothetical protein [Rhizobium]TCU22890.1 hypothetical protein EV130_10831 [Rhizobium azibense]TCU36467.1 hypothetical protein EV129_10731 [Rhizobium azibense]
MRPSGRLRSSLQPSRLATLIAAAGWMAHAAALKEADAAATAATIKNQGQDFCRG